MKIQKKGCMKLLPNKTENIRLENIIDNIQEKNELQHILIFDHFSKIK